jgi:hypothetical protein|tara:strand:- start:123 stop:473 length:351 start_codon:yes stop_codon:yes gene_type:complete
MSNLSDLLPSGGSAGKTLTATASANITLGQTVALNANGTVQPVTTASGNAANFIGLADAAISNGVSGNISIQGGVGTSTTVVIGTDYFVATDGSIATTGTVKLGRAITTSQILMTG